MSYTNHNQGVTLLEGQPLQDNRRSWQGPGSFYSRGSRSSNLSRATAGPGATGRTYPRHLRKKLSDLMKPAQPAAQALPVVPGTPTAPPAASVPPVQLSIDQLYSKLKEAASAKPQGQEKTWNDEVTNAKECKKTGSTEAVSKAVTLYTIAIDRQGPAYGAIKAVARALRQCTPSQDSEERQVLHYMLAQLYRILGDRRQFSLHATLWLSKYGYTGKCLTPGQFNVPMNALEMVSDLDLYRIEKVAKLVKKRLTSKKGAKRLVQDEQTITGEQNKLKSALYWQASIDYDGMEKEQLDGSLKRGQKLYDLWDRAVRINDFAGYACGATNYKRNTVVLTEPAFHWTQGQFWGRCNKRVEEGAFLLRSGCNESEDTKPRNRKTHFGDMVHKENEKSTDAQESQEPNPSTPQVATERRPDEPKEEFSQCTIVYPVNFYLELTRTLLSIHVSAGPEATVKKCLDHFVVEYNRAYQDNLRRESLAIRVRGIGRFSVQVQHYSESTTVHSIGVRPFETLWVDELPASQMTDKFENQDTNPVAQQAAQPPPAAPGTSDTTRVEPVPKQTLALPNTGSGGQAPQGRAMKSHNPAMCSVFKWRSVLSNRGHLIYQLVDYCGGVDKFARLWSKGEAFSKRNPGQMKAWPLIAVKLLFGRQVNKLMAAERGSDGLQAAPSDLNVDGTRKTKAQKNAERKAKQGQTQQYNLTTLVESFQTVSILVATNPNVSEPDQLALLEMVYYLLRFMAVHCAGKEQIQTGGGDGGGSGGSIFRSKRRSTAGSTVSGVSSHSGKSRGSNFTGGSRSRSMMLKGSSKSYGGYALGAFSGLLRPSCDNNLRRRLNHKGMIEYVATREIVNTEPLTLSFGANMAKYPKGVKREQEIIKRFGFECACRDCRSIGQQYGTSPQGSNSHKSV